MISLNILFIEICHGHFITLPGLVWEAKSIFNTQKICLKKKKKSFGKKLKALLMVQKT
jgi:hypothetical protein